MTTPSRWDRVRAAKKGQHDAGLPHCKRCKKVSVLDPCRDCATPEELAKYPPPPRDR